MRIINRLNNKDKFNIDLVIIEHGHINIFISFPDGKQVQRKYFFDEDFDEEIVECPGSDIDG